MILIIDNYDSFVHNLERYLICLNYKTQVVRNDRICLSDIEKLNPSHILLSPGPCAPQDAGICLELVRTFSLSIPILGVCLGHQVIAEAFGGTITHAPYPSHGKSQVCTHDGAELFDGISNPMQVGLYHSLCVSDQGIPDEIEILSRCQRNTIMAIKHRNRACYGVQFHPESILTPEGSALLSNFLRVTEHAG